ncbi:MAG TPA: efflux transporter outer membrane subunit [Acidocella sp.]|uniref:efflux transporter outer membrane subunit n=1 Tax=Acidocella sp. TaxID=50710 RepID=UPI002C996658|nr:efflux transporter outer membrane subunit [Acidocella sp.]HVE21375.1 efflux transporter outer membrane subunit [Acidocella sp.]
MRHSLATTALLGLLSGCSLIPVYKRPALPVSPEWPASAGPAGSGTAAADIGWRNFFCDPALQGLIALSLANNRDLRVATLNVQAAQAQYRVDRANLFPMVDATAGRNVYHTPADVMGTATPLNYRDYSLGVGAVSWELDLFGKIRSQAKAAHETYLSDADTALSTQIMLVAEVSSEYYTWLADRESLQISQDTMAVQAHSLQLTQMSATHGIDTAMDVAQAQTTLDTAQAMVALYTRQVAEDMDELVLLAGAPIPHGLLAQMSAVPGLDASPALPDLPAGLPSDLLERRPDIRSAEHVLLAANANIGAARAAFFPSITITANGGTASSGLNHLFGPASGSWLFDPSITVPIFAAGQNIANLDMARVERNIEIAAYEKTIQSAFHDVADALNARGTYVAQVQAQQNLVDADSRYYQLADMRFRAGVDNYLNVLVAENALFSARLTLVSLKLAAQQNSLTLYKALGGGWQETSAPAPALP